MQRWPSKFLGIFRSGWRSFRSLSAAIKALVMFAAAVAAVGAWLLPGYFSKADPTAVYIVKAGPRAHQSQQNPHPAVCAKTSFRSPRRDAQSCLVGGNLLLDPCFDISARIVDCVRPGQPDHPIEHDYNRVLKSVPFATHRMLRKHQVSIQSAARDYLPWAIQVRSPSGNVTCWLDQTNMTDASRAGGEPDPYDCRDLSGLDIVADPRGYRSGDDLTIWRSLSKAESDGAPSAIGLDESTDPWTVKYSSPTSPAWTTVEVSAAWF